MPTADRAKIIQLEGATPEKNVLLVASTLISLHFIKGHIREGEGGGNVPREDANTNTNTSENKRLAGER